MHVKDIRVRGQVESILGHEPGGQDLPSEFGSVGAAEVEVSFADLEGHDVARIEFGPAAKPVFATPLKGDKREQFLVRINNSTQEVVGQEALDYQHKRWPE